MPTSYTAPIEDGNTNARDFVTHCARAFGAFAHQREEGIDVPPQPVEVETDSYYAKRLIEVDAKLAGLKALTPDEIENRYNEYFDYLTESNVKSILSHREMVARYQSVKEKVEAWEPSEEALPLKEYALDQLKVSWPYDPHISTPVETPEKWHEGELTLAAELVEYYERELSEELARLQARRDFGIKMLKSVAEVQE